MTSVQSLANGPKDFQDAMKSPFWRRLLIPKGEKTSNVVVFASGKDSEHLIGSMEAIIAKYKRANLQIEIAGAPYVAEMIRRNLRHDFIAFTITSVLLFGVALAVLFRSWKITVGVLAACGSAVLVPLVVQALLGQKIGILTANITTIVFVVTLSHLVYMTFNWQTIAGRSDESSDLASKAWRMTLPASFWSMICAALGFASLLIVPAKPLRELGIGGVAGTVIASVCAYLMYPAFLNWTTPEQTHMLMGGAGSPFWRKRFVGISAATILGTAFLCIGIPV